MINTLPIRRFSFAVGCLVILFGVSVTNAQNSSIEFPYQALVAKDNALVRSGPGKVHYGTQKLAAGQVVEVYRHDPDGWCAIRPVEGSFCIIPEATVEVIGEGVGEIKLAGTTPFVGTKLGTVEKPLWQVKLREKEKVSLIGQLSWPNPEGHSTIWYQIKPPAGEFRWINISDLESLSGETMASLASPPQPTKMATIPKPAQPKPAQPKPAQPDRFVKLPTALAAPSAQIASQQSVAPVKPSFDLATAQRPPATGESSVGESSVQLASFAAAPATTAPPLQDSGSGWRRATRAIPSGASSNGSGGFTSQSLTSANRSQSGASANYNNSSFGNSNFTSEQNRPYGSYDSNTNNQPQASFAGQIRVADASPDRSRFAQQLGQAGSASQTYSGQAATGNALQTLNNRLTLEMLKDPSEWQLAPLEAATRQYISTGNYTEKQAGNQFLAKLANCRQVAARYNNGQGISNGRNPNTGRNLGSGRNLSSGQNLGSGSRTSFVGANTNRLNGSDNSQFDATGWLNELKQGRGTEPSTYVLQDETGKIIYHLSVTPGLNLQRYLRKRVGVNGQLGFNQRLNLRHVTVERVFPL